ncbi:hypothetical protein TNCV_545121 [Trichonephila clavipes]|nr:hypothetical protein TNCV_545121 [Trichonephila clavipes]
MNSLTTCAEAWTLSLETMAAVTLDAASSAGVSSMVKCSTVALSCNRKRLDHGCLVASSSPVTMVDELWHRVEAAWASVPVHAIQSMFDSIPR